MSDAVSVLERPASSDEHQTCFDSKSRKSFTKESDILLLEAIDQVLADLLGTSSREIIYNYLERNCSMSRREVPERLVDFCHVLETTFGRGAVTIERTITRKFYSKLGRKFIDYPGYTLVEYVKWSKSHSHKSQDR
jgi:hypothetical protein